MSKKEEEKNSLKRPSMDRTGLRSFSGNPEEFELSFYGIFMACIPIHFRRYRLVQLVTFIYNSFLIVFWLLPRSL
ncbi:hypothetical protein AS888_03560 [Peribacillus simplex]|uniref:Transmembrane protein n=1 Tax=Peribacillus simplex TaxID=1478 RepID=A0A109N367_9BACI|nr:hypothetical protein [Peribacillus simplex]KWW22698.1 hypothetical protein AS888_03560 [Peribacillus simplex]